MEKGQDGFIEENGGSRRIKIIITDGEQKVFLKGQPYMSWRCEDTVGPRVAIVQMYESGTASQEELAEAFGVNERTIRNYLAAYKIAGMGGLISQPKGPKESWKIRGETRFKILEMAYGNRKMTYGQMAEAIKSRWKVDVSVNSIRQVLMENGFIEERLKGAENRPLELFGKPEGQLEMNLKTAVDEETNERKREAEEKINREADKENLNREKNRSDYSQAERVYLDRLERGEYSAYAGGLFFIPLLERHHFLETVKRVIEMETHEGYSLEQLCLTLFYFDVFEYRSVEDFKTVYPEEYGVLLGRGQSPSLQTLRRFLHHVRKLKRGDSLIEEFSKDYLKGGLVKWGVMYIDGHFLPYYGERVITMGWDGVREKAMKGSYQFLAVDEKFNPMIFFLRPSSDDLLEIIPEMIGKARDCAATVGVGAEDLTIVFDREGYSAELFRTLNEMEPKVTFITWAKYMDRWVGEYRPEQFDKSVVVDYEIQDEKEFKYHETERVMNKYGSIRTLVLEGKRGGPRAAIFTNDENSEGGRIIQVMSRRWGHETLNKTFKWDHKMDYHPGYWAEEIEEQPMVENPKWEELKKQKAGAVSQLNSLRIKFAQAALGETKEDANLKEIKEKNRELCGEMDSLHAQITLLELEIGKCGKEIRFDQAHNGKKLVELDYEKKRFLDCIKVFTYMMEKQMCAILSRHYGNPKDIYSILAMIIRRGGEVKLEDGKPRVRLKRFMNSEVDYVARQLCKDLNELSPRTLDKFRWPICYEVA